MATNVISKKAESIIRALLRRRLYFLVSVIRSWSLLITFILVSYVAIQEVHNPSRIVTYSKVGLVFLVLLELSIKIRETYQVYTNERLRKMNRWYRANYKDTQ